MSQASEKSLLHDFNSLQKQFLERQLWARGYFAVSSPHSTDEMIQQYLQEQEEEPTSLAIAIHFKATRLELHLL